MLENSLHRQLALNTLSVQALHTTFEDLKRMAKKKNLLLVSPQIDKIFNAKISLMKTGSGIKVFLTMPLFDEEDLIRVFEFNSVPFYVTNNSMVSI